ncbi:hypothetical protein LZC95_51940 [Pendulispora brunnea]|uniref:Uncharacterized protein n=1 Tax=Pendulispora brunnea TaxID=2905690 RepID=A0ABZ2K8B1_9BACT
MNNPYQPPGASSVESATEYVVPIDDAAARVSFTLAPGWWSYPVLLVDGQPPRKLGRSGFELPMRDGSKAQLRIVPSLTRRIPRVSVNGRKYGEGGQWDGWGYAILILMPMGCLMPQGIVGGVLGAFALTINRQIAYNPGRWWLKALAMLMLDVAVVAAFIGTRRLLQT